MPAIRDLFIHDVTRNIPPVVYFHEQTAERLAAEVSEYIITGGYPDDDVRHRRVPEGIHEAYVKLLSRMREAIERPGGVDLPASWVSGAYGSGKSSFAKLLGLALDGVLLPDGTELATALLRRDDAPKAHEFVQAWQQLTARIKARAVVFDIGSVARENEQIHVAALRQAQARLGYCPHKDRVAAYELLLETDGRWGDFLAAAQKTLGRPWSEAMRDALAEDHFSHVLHVLEPTRYRDPMAWLDVHQARRSDAGTSVAEVVDTLGRMLQHRAPDRTLFFVIDEVSQYIHQDEGRMLALQGFVSELGQRLRGRAWVIATGQQKLEQAESHIIGKLKDRFPAPLRVHLTNSNIRDVVHKRLLQKRDDRVGPLRDAFQKHRADLTVHALDGEGISEVEFLEAYPMLPWHVEVLLQITSALRIRSNRAQGDDQTLRGLLQLLGELFRERNLADGELGRLVTFDEIYEVQRTALDADLQDSLVRIRRHEVVEKNPFAWRVARVIALLQQIQDQRPTTDALIARCLYERLGQGSSLATVHAALDALRGADLVAYSEKEGYAIQSAAGQEWQREREEFGPDLAALSALVREPVKQLLGGAERPKLANSQRSLAWSAWFSDERSIKDDHIVPARANDAEAPLDLRLLWSASARGHDRWNVESARGESQDRLVWVVGETSAVERIARESARTARMLERYAPRRLSLPRDRQMLLLAEEGRREELSRQLRDAVEAAFLDGTLWFRGRRIAPRDRGASFAAVALATMQEVLPTLYPSFKDVAVSQQETDKLLLKDPQGPPSKFLDGPLKVLSLDNGRLISECSGAVPVAVLQHLEQHGGILGGELLAHFARPPWGWSADMVKASLAGLLRAGRLRVQTPGNATVTSFSEGDAGALFKQDRTLRLSAYFERTGPVGPRDRVAIARLFQERLNTTIDRADDAIADAVWTHFPVQRARLREVERQLACLGLALDPSLVALGLALEGCQARQVEQSVINVKQSLNALRDGLDTLAIVHGELTDTAVAAVLDLRAVVDGELEQLVAVDPASVQEHAMSLRAQASKTTPWRGVGELRTTVDAVRARYREVRATLLDGLAAKVEATRRAMQARPGFAELGPDARHRVLRPLSTVVPDTRAVDLRPSLDDLRERMPARLQRAEEECLRALDEERDRDVDERGPGPSPVVPLEANLRGREITSEADLRAVLDELERRVREKLAAGLRVRFR